jgi:hypothetical protein
MLWDSGPFGNCRDSLTTIATAIWARRNVWQKMDVRVTAAHPSGAGHLGMSNSPASMV